MHQACAFTVDAFAATFGGFFLGVFVTGLVLTVVRIVASKPPHFPDEPYGDFPHVRRVGP